MIGLAGLPLLMLASIILKAPFAGPAAISLGYLGAAHALYAGRARRAAVWTTAVLGGFIGWTLLSSLARPDFPSWPSLAAVLMAPAFAAAPALTRWLAGAKADPQPSAALTPAAALALCPAIPAVANAGVPQGGEARQETPAPLPSTAAVANTDAGAPGDAAAPHGCRAAPASDVQDAVAFALRLVARAARAKGVSLISSGDPTVAAACDRQICRRILTSLLGEVVRASPLGASVHVLVRGVRGAVLVRVSCAGPAGSPDGSAPARAPLDLAALRVVLDQIGGTLMTTESTDGLCASLRLARADAIVRQGHGNQGSGAA